MARIDIKGLHAGIPGKEILKGVDLSIDSSEILAVLGPNGHGKSTLLAVLMGNPRYEVTAGSITLDGEDLLAMGPDLRSRRGLFLAMQNPSEVPGLNSADFYKSMMNAHRQKPMSLAEFYKSLQSAYKAMGIPFEMSSRNLNEGFSGGEKKRNEILQMLLLQPTFAFLDETDSGLDVDAMKIVANAINAQKEKGTGFVVVSHYERLFELVHPTRTVVLVNGQIAIEGGPELASKIDREGYEWLKREYGISLEKDDKPQNKISIGSCATKVALNGK